MKTIIVDSETNIKRVKVFKETVLQYLSEDNEIVLNFKNTERLDLSIVQVIASAYDYAKKNKQRIKLQNVSPEIKKQLSICGLIRQ